MLCPVTAGLSETTRLPGGSGSSITTDCSGFPGQVCHHPSPALTQHRPGLTARESRRYIAVCTRKAGIPPDAMKNTRRKHLTGLVVLAALALATPPLLRTGDLLALPAVALVLAVWLVISLMIGLRLLVIDLIVPVGTIARRLGKLAWHGMVDDPSLRQLQRKWSLLSQRLKPLGPGFRALKRWLSFDEKGLGRTVAIVAALLAAGTLWRLERWISITGSPLVQLDHRFSGMFQRLSVPVERTLMVWFSAGAEPLAIGLAIVVITAGAIAARARRAALVLVAISVLSTVMVEVLKVTVHRLRPPFGQIVEGSFSWPSGHAASSLALALGICLLLWRSDRVRWSAVAVLVVPWALLVGYSRAYLTVHWTSDVVAGWLIAIAAAGIVTAVDLSFPRKRPALRTGFFYGGLAGSLIVVMAFALFGRSLPAAPEQAFTPTRVATVDPNVALKDIDLFLSLIHISEPTRPY